jgi:hypothetical protein
MSNVSPHRNVKVMRRNSLLLAVALWLVASRCHAQASSPEHDALLFLDSQVFPAKAAACSTRITGYSAKFDPAFRTWLAGNKEHLAAGEAFLRADAEKTKVPFDGDVKAVAATVAQQWSTASMAVLQENCAVLLQQLSSEVPTGG